MNNMTPSEILRNAIQHVENGWCRGNFQDDQGNVCAAGALRKSAFGTVMIYALTLWEGHQNLVAFNKANQALSEYAREIDKGCITRMNDTAADKQDILNALEKTALRFEERGE